MIRTKFAIWNSPKGYSLPNEKVEVIKHGESKVCIRSKADADETGPDAFDIWVDESELTEIKEPTFNYLFAASPYLLKRKSDNARCKMRPMPKFANIGPFEKKYRRKRRFVSHGEKVALAVNTKRFEASHNTQDRIYIRMFGA